MNTISEWWMWPGFLLFVFIVLALDIFLLSGKKARVIYTKEAVSWLILWIGLALVFNLFLWAYLTETQGAEIAQTKAIEFLTGYLLELSLSIDNVFMFLTIFTFFKVPPQYQRRILLLGILGAIFMRLGMILLGIFLIQKFHSIFYFFGAFLVFTGIKMLFFSEQKPDLSKNIIYRLLNRFFKVKHDYQGEEFFVRKNGLLYITPLFIVLIMVECTDIVFAIDSIPAIFAITSDPFIIFTSNIFAILGLRSLYFLIARIAERFYLLKYGLALILIVIGCKMLLSIWISVSALLTLSLVVIILSTFILLSIYLPEKSALYRPKRY